MSRLNDTKATIRLADQRNTATGTVLLLGDIAKSLAVIADHLTEKDLMYEQLKAFVQKENEQTD